MAETAGTAALISDSDMNYWFSFLMMYLILEGKPKCPEFYFCPSMEQHLMPWIWLDLISYPNSPVLCPTQTLAT